MTSAQVSNFQSYRMAVHELAGFFYFNLIFGIVAHLERTLQRCFAFSFYDIITAIGFIDEHTERFWRYLYDTAADSVVV